MPDQDGAGSVLFFDKAETLAKIQSAQIAALQAIRTLHKGDERSLRRIMQKFLRKSAIWDTLLFTHGLFEHR